MIDSAEKKYCYVFIISIKILKYVRRLINNSITHSSSSQELELPCKTFLSILLRFVKAGFIKPRFCASSFTVIQRS